VAGVEDYEVALATYHAAIKRWPGTPISLRQGARVIEDSRRLRLAWLRNTLPERVVLAASAGFSFSQKNIS
jgi:hypothetical protein